MSENRGCARSRMEATVGRCLGTPTESGTGSGTGRARDTPAGIGEMPEMGEMPGMGEMPETPEMEETAEIGMAIGRRIRMGAAGKPVGSYPQCDLENAVCSVAQW